MATVFTLAITQDLGHFPNIHFFYYYLALSYYTVLCPWRRWYLPGLECIFRMCMSLLTVCPVLRCFANENRGSCFTELCSACRPAPARRTTLMTCTVFLFYLTSTCCTVVFCLKRLIIEFRQGEL